MDKIKVQIIIKTSFLGEYVGEVLEVDESTYNNMMDYSKAFWTQDFQLFLEDGAFLVVPNEILKTSVLILKKLTD
jgi:hypothetical protein